MSTAEVVPEWTRADRLAKARQVAGLTQQGMADFLGLSKSAVAKFEGGAHVRSAYLRLWAVRCGVPYEWLLNGNEPDRTPPGPRGAEMSPTPDESGPDHRDNHSYPYQECAA